MHESNNIDLSNSWRHPGKIPATGRGNSSSGEHWLNPTDNQLLRACQRKGKNFEERDKQVVANIHGQVIEKTWAEIIKYENLHTGCLSPKLDRFYGKSEQLSFKARLLSYSGFPKPFDRHDWIVDRCGKEVRYVIDYYGGDFDPASPLKGDLVIDCRPAMTPEGVFDRLRVFKRNLWNSINANE